MFESKMELSDIFRYVIENMFFCNENDFHTEEYVKEFIFDSFGLAYISSILLGGIAHQNIFINREARQSINVQYQAAISGRPCRNQYKHYK